MQLNDLSRTEYVAILDLRHGVKSFVNRCDNCSAIRGHFPGCYRRDHPRTWLAPHVRDGHSEPPQSLGAPSGPGGASGGTGGTTEAPGGRCVACRFMATYGFNGTDEHTCGVW